MRKSVFIVISSFLSASSFAQSCPMCKESMTEAGEKLSQGFYSSIMAMVFLPTILVSAAAVFIITAVYNKRHPEANANFFQIASIFLRSRFVKQPR